MNSKNDIAKALNPLAEAMKAKKEIGEPYILCMGEGATLSSGCRAMRWAVRVTIAQECPWVLDNILADLGRPERCGEDSDKFAKLLETISEDEWYVPLLREFFKLLDYRRGQERMQILNSFLSEDYPSAGYNFLAVLAREGFFNVIFNANYDHLLETALNRYLPVIDKQGRPLQPYERLINRSDPSFKMDIEEAFNLRTPRIKVVWLHGHLWETKWRIAFTPQEKRDWYPNVKDVIEKHFAQDLLLIGYTDRDTDIRLALENARGDGTVWYVAADRPGIDIATALLARKHQNISGQGADFDTFCQVLFDLTLDLTDPNKVHKDDAHCLGLLREKREILDEYIRTLGRRENQDPLAPSSLQDQKEALQREVKAIEETLKSLE